MLSGNKTKCRSIPTILLVSLTIFAGLPGVALAFKQRFHEQITEEILKAQGFDVGSADQVGNANWYTDFREAVSDAAHADNNQLGAASTRLRSKRTDIGDAPTLDFVTFKDAPDDRGVICVRVRVRNVSAADTTYSLQALSSLGWAVDGPPTVTVAAAGFADVTFSVQVPPGAAEGSVSEVTILAEDTTSPTVRNSATVSVISGSINQPSSAARRLRRNLAFPPEPQDQQDWDPGCGSRR